MFGRQIDSIPYKVSIGKADLNQITIRLAQTPAREAIAQHIKAMGNVNINPTQPLLINNSPN